MENTSINGYILKYKLGEGGMAEVWYAENALRKPAAMKILKRRFCDNPEIVSRFENEAQVMVHMNHPHVRNIFDYTTIDGCPCLVMEYLEGKDLGQLLKEGQQFSNDQLITWWNTIVDALQYTHRKGIVHRDIKPSNLFITENNNIKLLDFGIAKMEDNITVTQTGSTIGTLLYMSPEQVFDTKDLTYKTDNYSLAVTFYHLITGQPPYNDKASAFEIQEHIVRRELNTFNLPEPWRSLLPGYLRKKPEERNELRKIDIAAAYPADETIAFTPLVPRPVPVEQVVPIEPEKGASRGWAYLLFSVLVICSLVIFVLKEDSLAPYLKKWLGSSEKPGTEETIAEPPIQKKKPAIEPAAPVIVPPDTLVTHDSDGNTNEVVLTGDTHAREESIKTKMADYYKSRGDCSTLPNFFADTVKQYYNKNNQPLTKAMKECEAYHKKWQFTEADINDDSYVFNHQADGNTYVDFSMLYKIKEQQADDWIPYNIDVSAVLDRNLKIARIVERRIEKL